MVTVSYSAQCKKRWPLCKIFSVLTTVGLGMESRQGQTPQWVASKKKPAASRMSWLAWFVSLWFPPRSVGTLITRSASGVSFRTYDSSIELIISSHCSTYRMHSSRKCLMSSVACSHAQRGDSTRLPCLYRWSLSLENLRRSRFSLVSAGLVSRWFFGFRLTVGMMVWSSLVVCPWSQLSCHFSVRFVFPSLCILIVVIWYPPLCSCLMSIYGFLL